MMGAPSQYQQPPMGGGGGCMPGGYNGRQLGPGPYTGGGFSQFSGPNPTNISQNPSQYGAAQPYGTI